MKNLVRKNQIIITALAILIAVAGYLNYTERNALNQTSKTGETVTTGNPSEVGLNPVNADALKDFEEDDLLKSTDDILSLDGDGSENEAEVTGETQDVAANAANPEGQETSAPEETTAEPGEAILTNNSTFSANARLSREQVRAQNKETLLNAVNSGGLSDEQKNQITNEMLKITQIAELENATEMLLAAKGFGDAVVNISDEQVEIVVNSTDVSDVSRAQIEDVVKRKTGKAAENIIITPITDEN